MYDDLRNISDSADYFEEDDPFDELRERAPQTRVFGMTAGQRLLIAILLLATIIVMGAMALLVTSRVWLF
jgi:hypothetical protein